MHFENGPDAKNGLKPNAKNAHKNKKNVSLCVSKMGQMPKTLIKMRKMYNQAACVCAFQKCVECQKRLKSTELDEKCYNQSMFEGKRKDAVLPQPMLLENYKLYKVSLAYTLTK